MAYELQKSFAAGEISPLMYLRNDKEAFHAAAVKRMENVVGISQGPAESRFGFEYIEEIDEVYCRLFEFEVSFSEAYVIVVGLNNIHIIDRSGHTLLGNLVLNPHFSDGGDNWIDDNVLFASGLATLIQHPIQDSYLRQELTTTEPGEEHVLDILGFGVPAGSFQVRIGTTEGGSDIVSTIALGKDAFVQFTPPDVTFWIEVRISGGGDYTKSFDSIKVYPISDPGIVEFPSTYTEQGIRELQVAMAPGDKVLRMVTRSHEPMEITYDGNHIWDYHVVEFEFGGDPDPNDPPWLDEYPGCITYHEGRMWLGGTYSQPITLWGSKPLDYTNFDQGDPSDVQPDDGMTLPLDKHGELQWIQSNRRLFAGLDTGEHVIYGVQGPITPGNAHTEQHSTYGSSRIHALVIDEEIGYVDTRGRKVRLMNFNDTHQNWASIDITFAAEHITSGRLHEMKFGRSPRSVIILPTNDGDLVIANYEKDQGTIGWSRHHTQGFIISTALVSEFGLDVPWIAVRRNGKTYIERYDTITNYYLDSSHIETSLTPETHFTGFDHLEGLEVQVVVDRAMHPSVTVGPGGTIDLLWPGNEVIAGLGFTALLETLPEQKQVEAGNTLTFKKRYSSIAVAIIDSARPIINGFDSYTRNPATPMGEAEPFRTEIIEVGNLGWSQSSTVTVEQPLPAPMTIAGIGGKLKENKL